MQIIFNDEVFEKAAATHLQAAYEQLPSAATFPIRSFPKVDVAIPLEEDKGFAIQYKFQLHRAPDRRENNDWHVVSATRIKYVKPAPPKETK